MGSAGVEFRSDISIGRGQRTAKTFSYTTAFAEAALDGKPDVSGPKARGEETERRRFASVALLSTHAETFVSAQRYFASRLF